MPPTPERTGAQANRTVRELRRRAGANLTERRRRQDQLVAAAVSALVARERARAAITKAQTRIDEALAELRELGLGRTELANLVDLSALGQRPGGNGDRPPAEVALEGPTGDGGGAVRIRLGMIERGPSPKTHALARGGALLCPGRSEPGELTTWVGYAFDVDCQRCVKLLTEQLTEEEFG